MQIVGLLLQKEAVKSQGLDRDLFARSAYNRYYYSVFLATRSMMQEFDPKWATLPHKSYPELLKGQVIKTFTKQRSKANKNNDQELVNKIESAVRATKALASLFEKAYGVRVVADYEPGELVDFSTADRFSLMSVKITEAHGWDAAVNLWAKAIKSAWTQFNG